MSQIIEMAPGGDSSVSTARSLANYRGYSVSETTDVGVINQSTGNALGTMQTYNGGSGINSFSRGNIAPTSIMTEVVRGVYYDLDPGDLPNTLETTFSEMWFGASLLIDHLTSFTQPETPDPFLFKLRGKILVDIITEKFDPTAKNFTTVAALARTNIIDQVTYGQIQLGAATDGAEGTNVLISFDEQNAENICMNYLSRSTTCHAIMIRVQIASDGAPVAAGNIRGYVRLQNLNNVQFEVISSQRQWVRSLLLL